VGRENMSDTKKNIKFIIFICLGILLLVTTGIAYLPKFLVGGMYEFELTFLSNLMAGIAFLTGGILGLVRNKELPRTLYLDTTVLLALVFLTCMAFITEMNFTGAFVFLHVINPILAILVFVFLTADARPLKKIEILSTIFFPVAYLAYAITYGLLSGYWLYGFINIDKKGILFVSILCVIMAAGIILVSLLLYGISQLIYKKAVQKS
jgi:hypothetical protein